MLGIGLIWILHLLLSLVSNLFQSLHPFPSNGLLILRLFIAFLKKSLNSQIPTIKFFQSKMASSQVEIAASSPFGCVLRDHNRREICSNTHTAFQKNLKHYLHTCISNPTQVDENSVNTGEVLSPISRKHARVVERWAKAREVVTAVDRTCREEGENLPAQSDSSVVEIPNLGGVSSLVQRWKDFTEAKLISQNTRGNHNSNPNTTLSLASPPVGSSSSSSKGGNSENALFVDETCGESVDERFDTPSMMTEDSFMDWESDRSGPPSTQGRDSTDGGESERLRVADVIRKLTSENQMQGSLMSWKSDVHDREQGSAAGYEFLLPRLRMVGSDHQMEQRGFSPVVNSPRIRGRQAFNDLLMQLERDRHRELDGLVERRAVSKFSHRGRIQSLLRLRFLRRREAEVGYDQHQHLRRQAAIGAQQQQQQHSYSRVVGVQRQSHCEAAVEEAPCHSHSAASATEEVEARQHFHHEGEIGVQVEQLSCFGNQQLSCSEAVGLQQNSHGKAAVADGQQSNPMLSESSRPKQGSAIVHLREKFDIRVQQEAASPKPPRGVVSNNIPDVKSSSSSSIQLTEEPQHHHNQEVNTSMQQSIIFSAQNLVSCGTEYAYEEAGPSSDHTIRQEVNNQEDQTAIKEEDTINPFSSEGGDWEEEQEASNQRLLVGTDDQDWISELSHTWSEWDEQEANNNQQLIIGGANQDWISDIARPRSDWEGLRQERYREMLDPFLENQEIRQLLERRSVSTFLSSNLRDAMDQLMISRVERLPNSVGNEQEEEGGLRERLQQLMLSHIQRQTQTMNGHQEDEEQEEEAEEEDEERVDEEREEEHEEEGGGEKEHDDDGDYDDDDDGDDDDDDEEEEEEEEKESPIRRQSSEVGDYVDQVEAGPRSWSHDGDREASDDSDQVASPSSQQPRSSQAYYPDTRLCSSSTNRSSIEMELIYDLRGHMEQLHREMFELRKSIKSCVNMQAKLQRSIKHEVADAVSRSVRRVGKESFNGGPRKRSCCVCYEMQVDSLLYRCGHMCTCFKCAHELQWSSGKCPICRAPIVDVVRAYANDS